MCVKLLDTEVGPNLLAPRRGARTQALCAMPGVHPSRNNSLSWTACRSLPRRRFGAAPRFIVGPSVVQTCAFSSDGGLPKGIFIPACGPSRVASLRIHGIASVDVISNLPADCSARWDTYPRRSYCRTVGMLIPCPCHGIGHWTSLLCLLSGLRSMFPCPVSPRGVCSLPIVVVCGRCH